MYYTVQTFKCNFWIFQKNFLYYVCLWAVKVWCQAQFVYCCYHCYCHLLLCDCKCVLDTGGGDATASMWKPEDSSLEFYLFHVYMVSREKTQLTRLAEHPSCQPLPILSTKCVCAAAEFCLLFVREINTEQKEGPGMLAHWHIIHFTQACRYLVYGGSPVWEPSPHRYDSCARRVFWVIGYYSRLFADIDCVYEYIMCW